MRALVLGGGGVTGIAWEIGVLAGLAERGLDLAASADLVIGTSAGSAVGAHLRGGLPPAEALARQLEEPGSDPGARIPLSVIVRFLLAALVPGGEEAAGRSIGRAALRARTLPEESLTNVIDGLAANDWPAGRLLITTVDRREREGARV